MPPTIKTPAANASSNSLASPPIMAAPLSPASVKSRRELLRDHDTGFPEPLGGRSTTTLPHPEADLSPNAFLTSDSADQVISKRRFSLLRKHRRNVSHTSTNTEASSATGQHMVHGVLPLIAGMIPSGAATSVNTVGARANTAVSSSSLGSRNGSKPFLLQPASNNSSISVGSTASRRVGTARSTTDEEGHDTTPPSSPDSMRAGSVRKKSLFGRMRKTRG